MIRVLSFFVFFLSYVTLEAQISYKIEDLQAIKNRNMTFYNLDTYTITSQSYSSAFNDKKLKPILREYKIRLKKSTPLKDSLVNVTHYKFLQKSKTGNYINNYAVYAIENKGRTSVITFSKIGELDSKFMSSFIDDFVNTRFPKSIYQKIEIDSIKFVNRYIRLGRGCRWMGVRNVQCPYNGQMDWTLHPSLEEAKNFNKIRSYLTTNERKLKLISKDSVNIKFEGKESKAEKLVLDVKGLNSLLLNLQSGAKKLIVYYIAQEIKGNYISCILSHWDNDRKQPDGLPALLGEVMVLQK